MKIPAAILKPVSIEDLRLGMHVSSAAYLKEFPLEPTTRGIDLGDGRVVTLNTDHPLVNITLALKRTFPENNGAVFWRLDALQGLVNQTEFEKWIKCEGERLEFADALVEAAAYYPLHKVTGNFRKGLLREVQRIADEKYQGQFT